MAQSKREERLLRGISESDLGIELHSDEEIVKLKQAEDVAGALEDDIAKLKQVVQEVLANNVNLRRLLIIDEVKPEEKVQFSNLIDKYLEIEQLFQKDTDRFHYSTLSRKIEELANLAKQIDTPDDEKRQDARLLTRSFKEFIQKQANTFKAAPRTEEERKYHPLVGQLKKVVDAFLQDLKKMEALGTDTSSFFYSTKWKLAIEDLERKYSNRPYKLFDILLAIDTEYNNVPPKIKASLNAVLQQLTEETRNFQKEFIDNNAKIGPPFKTKMNDFCGTILQYRLDSLGKPMEKKNPASFRML